MTETEQQDAEALAANWEVIRPIVAAAQQKTGLSRAETLLLWIITSMDNEEPEVWQQTA